MSEALKPCPFCGNAVYLEKKPLWRDCNGSTHGYFGCYEYVIECNNPECRCNVALKGNNTVYAKDEEAKQNAIEAWNRRANNEQIH